MKFKKINEDLMPQKNNIESNKSDDVKIYKFEFRNIGFKSGVGMYFSFYFTPRPSLSQGIYKIKNLNSIIKFLNGLSTIKVKIPVENDQINVDASNATEVSIKFPLVDSFIMGDKIKELDNIINKKIKIKVYKTI